MKRACLIVLLALGACSPSESERAERELALIEKSGGTGDELCQARRKVADAYLHEDKADKYRDAKFMARQTCLNAELAHRLE